MLTRNNSFLLNSNRSSLLCKLLSVMSFFASLLCSCIKNALFSSPVQLFALVAAAGVNEMPSILPVHLSSPRDHA